MWTGSRTPDGQSAEGIVRLPELRRGLGAVGGEVCLVRGMEHDRRGGRCGAAAGLRAHAIEPRPRRHSRGALRLHRRGAALLDRHAGARPGDGRGHRARLRAAHCGRARHRQVDAPAPARGIARPLRPACALLLGRGGRGAGPAQSRPPRARGSGRGARRRDEPPQYPGDARAREARRSRRHRFNPDAVVGPARSGTGDREPGAEPPRNRSCATRSRPAARSSSSAT